MASGISINIQIFTPTLWRFPMWLADNIPFPFATWLAGFILEHGWMYYRIEGTQHWGKISFKERHNGKPKTDG